MGRKKLEETSEKSCQIPECYIKFKLFKIN